MGTSGVLSCWERLPVIASADVDCVAHSMETGGDKTDSDEKVVAIVIVDRVVVR